MSRGWFSLSTPVWVNFGKNKGLPISCFGTTVQDDTFDIRGAAEIGAMSKVGGGTATYFGNLRPRGAKISTGGETNGSVSMMELFNTTTNIISQGKVRRGSWAAYWTWSMETSRSSCRSVVKGTLFRTCHLLSALETTG